MTFHFSESRPYFLLHSFYTLTPSALKLTPKPTRSRLDKRQWGKKLPSPIIFRDGDVLRKRAALLDFIFSVKGTADHQSLWSDNKIATNPALTKPRPKDEYNTNAEVAQLMWEVHEAAEACLKATH